MLAMERSGWDNIAYASFTGSCLSAEATLAFNLSTLYWGRLKRLSMFKIKTWVGDQLQSNSFQSLQHLAMEEGWLSKSFLPLFFLEPPVVFCSHIYLFLWTCIQTGQKTFPQANIENIVETEISQSALFFTPSLLLIYWRVFPVPVLKLFFTWLGPCAKALKLSYSWQRPVLLSLTTRIEGLGVHQSKFELKLGIFFTSSNIYFEVCVLQGPLRLSKKSHQDWEAWRED